MATSKRIVLAILVTLLAASRAGAGATPLGHGWELDFAPYLWLPAIEGRAGVDGRTVAVDVGYDDVLDLIGDHFSLIGAMGHLELRHGPISGFLDVVYTTLDTDDSADLKGIEDPRVSTGPIDVAVALKLDSVIFEFGAAYRALELALPDRSAPLVVEALAGGRYNYFWTSVHANAETTILGLPRGSQAVERAVSGGGDLDWVDPFVGGRFAVPLTDDLELRFRGDIGGFGAGSDLAWSLLGSLQYALAWRPLGIGPSLLLGYKVLSFDYDAGNLLIDLTYQGPFIGLNAAF